ncbi:MAG: PEP-CTERM sorting domain-containing protein [Sneathiella sp.]|uniref:PEP-CTERM sorting domain-containing protein n=1 Tax=Sneathiella sp. TaxID=1964365 RepID=UPI003002D842
MLKKCIHATAIAALSTFLMTGQASAVSVFDFVSWADNSSNVNYQDLGSVGNGEYGGQPITTLSAIDGISMEATGFAGDEAAFAYLDKGRAGMGVCKVITKSLQCNPSSDDNVTATELLVIDFNQEVNLLDMSFRDGKHNLLGDFDIDFYIDGISQGITLFDDAFFASGITGKKFGFGFVKEEFYISTMSVSAVPVPAALPLFGAALLGMGFLARRRKQKAALQA